MYAPAIFSSAQKNTNKQLCCWNILQSLEGSSIDRIALRCTVMVTTEFTRLLASSSSSARNIFMYLCRIVRYKMNLLNIFMKTLRFMLKQQRNKCALSGQKLRLLLRETATKIDNFAVRCAAKHLTDHVDRMERTLWFVRYKKCTTLKCIL